MSVAVCILAKDEAERISGILAQIARQLLMLDRGERVDIHVVANGCSDTTAETARQAAALFEGQRARLHVHDLKARGKSRAWNHAVHHLIDPATEFIVFCDADINFVDDGVVVRLLADLAQSETLAVCSGYPIKNVSAKKNRTVLDRFSLAVSGRTRHVGAINGSLYAARANCLADIWLPDDTPGEDGFLNAMVTTHGFTRPADATSVSTAPRPTHYFQAHDPLQFAGHERRMIVGTMINRWIFEHLWSLELRTPAGPTIDEWNRRDPEWVEKIIRRRSAKRHWLIPRAILFGRLGGTQRRSLIKRVAYLPLAVAATLLTIPPAISANRRLKQIGAAKSW